MELLLVRIDHFRDRKEYLSVLRTWLSEICIDNGRVITVGDVHLLFIVADAAQNSSLLEHFKTKEIDRNSKGELCVDRFIDVLGRKAVKKSSCKGFLEMNILNRELLARLLVQDWQAEPSWIETALATPRSKAFLEWRDAAKLARKERRKRSAHERIEKREAKKKIEQEAPAAADDDVAAVNDTNSSKDEEPSSPAAKSEASVPSKRPAEETSRPSEVGLTATAPKSKRHRRK